jgi:hypothetical protein
MNYYLNSLIFNGLDYPVKLLEKILKKSHQGLPNNLDTIEFKTKKDRKY